MAHQQQVDFCSSVKNKLPDYFVNQFVLDIGSLDINGNNQYLFEDCHYLGVDLAAGSNVDILSKGHELALPDATFDVLISTECFEHDPYYRSTLANAIRLLKPGGLLLFSCATTGRPEHGTKRTTPLDAPFLQELDEWSDYYQNLEEKDIRSAFDVDELFASYGFSTCAESHDLYFWGIKKGLRIQRTNYSFQVVKPSLHVALAQSKQITNFSLAAMERDTQIANLRLIINEYESQTINLRQLVNERDQNIDTLSQAINKFEYEIAILNHELIGRDNYISELTAMLLRMRQSLSWRLTIPVRMVGRLLRGEFTVIGDLFRNYASTRRVTHPLTVTRRLIELVYEAEQPFQLIKRKLQTLNRLILGRQFSEIGDVFKRYIGNVIAEPVEVGMAGNDDISILCTKHTFFIAHLIERELAQVGKQVQINLKYSQIADTGQLYIVICPQMFSVLPQNFVAFQLEQTINPRWFSNNYFEILNKAISIFDYSVINIEFLEKHKFQYQKLFYLPIGPFPEYAVFLQEKGYNLKNNTKDIDVLFYGDKNCLRRRQFLDPIKDKYKLVIASEVFGAELINLVRSAKVVINIHYYEDALLETTRIYEVLSLGVPIISEESTDMSEHANLQGIVSFTPIGDVEAMLEQIDTILKDRQGYQQKISAIGEFTYRDKTFSSYFKRYLLANDLISFDDYYQSVNFFPEVNVSVPRLCLTLTETVHRKQSFLGKETHGFQIIEGIRHRKGWLGCGMSYKFMLRRLHELGYSIAMICEDDVEFYASFEEKLDKIVSYLSTIEQPWTLFSGLIAHLHPDTVVTKIEEVDGIEYVYINKMVSMVMNIYSLSAIELIESWDQKNVDPYTNTIDRHIESSTDVVAITTLPFLVGHAEEQISSLWGFENTQYSNMINESEMLLRKKADAFKALNSMDLN